MTLARRSRLLLLVALALLGSVRLASPPPEADVAPQLAAGPLSEPQDWMNRQRAFPADTVEFGAFERAAEQAAALGRRTAGEDPALAGAAWELRGPTNVGARVSDLAIDPNNADTVYIAAASGGVWKSTDAGDTFAPAWPDDLTQALGALAITPDGTLFAGTGESNPGGGSLTFGGTGLYRSRDGGGTWERVGLENSGAFGRIMVDPDDPNTIFAAASGHLYLPGGERGVYRSTDGGDTWVQVLAGANATTGASDLQIDPQNPDRVFAVMWDHLRQPGLRTYGGVGSGLYASTDGGDTWARVEGGLPPSSPDVGRMGVGIAPSAPMQMYVTVIGTDGRFDALYRSSNGGTSWTQQPAAPLLGQSQSTFGWWFGRIFVDPVVPTHVFFPGVFLVESYDGGASAVVDALVHADQHALQFDPNVEGRVYLGNDGGVYRSDANGATGTYTAATYQPWTQSYTVDVGQQDPTRLVTGLQDNGTYRNYRADGTSAQDSWDNYNGGDGLESIIDPEDQSIIYGCSQYGNCRRSNNGGDSTTSITSGVHSPSSRRNWLTPLELDPTDPSVIYYAGSVVDRSTDRGATWTQISPDLTGGPETDIDPDYPFATITTVAIAPSDPNVLYVGTDDGLLWTTKDLGENWIRLEDPNLPGIYITRTAVDPTNADIAYVTYSGFRQGNDTPHVLRTADGGSTWTNISGDLPAAPVNDLEVTDDALVVATDVGVYLSRDLGASWLRVGSGLPLAPVLDIRYHQPTRALTAGTFGRGVFTVVVPEAPEPGPGPEPTPTVPPGPAPTPTGPPPTEPPASDRQVDRIDGEDRIATAARISRETFAPGVGAAYVATAATFPDALSGSAAAATNSAPVLLVTPDEVPDATARELLRLDAGRIVVLGGPEAISEDVERQLDNYTGGSTERLAGADRFQTAAEVSRATFAGGADVVYVATGADFPDALAGAAAAGRDGAPVLLVTRDAVPGRTGEELERLDPDRIVLLGGETAVSPQVAEALEGFAPVERVAGQDRFDTAAKIADSFETAPLVYVATGLDFPDALAVAPAAAVTASPVLLVSKEEVPAVAADALTGLDPDRVVIAGGPAAVSEEVARQLRSD